MRAYIFTDAERGLLREWLASGAEPSEVLHLFALTRRNLGRLVGDVRLLAAVAVELRRRGRLAGRGRVPRGCGRSSRRGG